MSNSGHHDCFTKSVFLCTPVKLQSCHIDVGTLNIPCLPHLSISIHSSLSCSMMFFQLKITLGLALGESWLLLARQQKNTDVQICPVSIFACFRGRVFLGIPYSSPRVAWQNWINQFGPKQGCCPLWAKFRLLYDNSFAPALGGAFAMETNTMALIQTCQVQAIMTVPQAGLATQAIFPRVLLCPLNIPKITIVHVIACSFNLHISYYCSSVFWEYGQRLVEYGQAIDPQNLSLSDFWKNPAFWRTLCHGNEHHGIDPNMLSIKFRPSWIMTVPRTLRFSAQLSNCNLATCWDIELSILGLPYLSISIHLSNSLSCSMKCPQRRA